MVFNATFEEPEWAVAPITKIYCDTARNCSLENFALLNISPFIEPLKDVKVDTLIQLSNEDILVNIKNSTDAFESIDEVTIEFSTIEYNSTTRNP